MIIFFNDLGRFFIEIRYQIVTFKDFWSTLLHVSSGVPQGSYLAPI